ncbi:DUF1822 family protein [Kamptonema formosum]|uniref:DUF1822 family protein n=1 Tax=Kamptonema formosum TaxID=331992 RepID=UPI00034926DE|nr:DUF1822 family protein [Oscillatoria sp. PCC 10802]
MTYSSHEIENFALPLPLTQNARRVAQQFASEQPTPQKAEQVRLNTLAVWVVNDYLQMMGIPTDLSAGDSWNRVVRLCADVADLQVTGAGRLECRPLKKGQRSCYIPPEVWQERIGYMVVEIDSSFQEACLLGFAPTAVTHSLPVSQLQPPEDLIDCLSQLRQPAPAAVPAAPARTAVNLSRWFSNIIEAGWQAVETVLNPPDESELAFSFRSLPFNFRSPDTSVPTELGLPEAGVRRAKLIDLGMQIVGHPVALIVELRLESEQKTNILLQVHPAGSHIYLPLGLQLTVLDESGATFQEVHSRSADNYIQLEFSGQPGERFFAQVAFGDASITEEFVI